MPSTLKRRHRQDLTLRKSFLETIRTKFSSVVTNQRRPRTNSTDHTSESTRGADQPIRRAEKHPHRRPPIPYVYTTHNIRVLPPELLAYTFILGAEEDPMLPITVSHVCSLWRELALHTPSLWRRIWLGSHYHIWRERIYRARSCSLDVVLWSPDPAQPFTWTLRPSSTLNFFQVQSYMHIVSPYIRRWRSLDIRLMNYSPYLWNGALSECCAWGVQAQAPLLEELILVHRQNDDTKEFCLFSGHAPRLRRAVIDGIRLSWLPSLFQNLTFLDYTHHGFTSGYQAIQEVVGLLQEDDHIEALQSFPKSISLS
ncbi:hypothetical protein D9758_002591 [Tetrapyrgos nigripes]|uniref:F-box domain-containing protein n=1 Tax=Tetrapyrgos nigripes TaxID=182062 RepID=A0A8H5GQR3_9AGAR|nr:hypothetical protein D9758_002591 [Tetrapyrgos nigripes]